MLCIKAKAKQSPACKPKSKVTDFLMFFLCKSFYNFFELNKHCIPA